jgi:transcriptional regulator with XRE-family HTH domain
MANFTRVFPNIGHLIKAARKQLNVSQIDLSMSMGYGNQGQFVSNVERMLCSIPASKIHIAAKKLQLEESDIIETMLKDEKINLELIVAASKLKGETK